MENILHIEVQQPLLNELEDQAPSLERQIVGNGSDNFPEIRVNFPLQRRTYAQNQTENRDEDILEGRLRSAVHNSRGLNINSNQS